MSEFMRSAQGFVLGILLAAGAPGVHAQAQPSGQTPTKKAAPAPRPAAPAAKPAGQAPAAAPSKPATPAAKPATGATKPPGQPPAGTAKPPAKPAGQAQGKPAPKAGTAKRGRKSAATAKKAGKPAAKAAKKTSKPARGAESETRVARRDPFESLIGRQRSAGGQTGPLPPGKAGLQVGTLRLDGVVRAPNGMICVVTNPQSRTYFLREGDQLYDGRVEKITMDAVSFHEVGKDAFGKLIEREVSKRIYSTPGETQ